jgi:hypothetical protein
MITVFNFEMFYKQKIYQTSNYETLINIKQGVKSSLCIRRLSRDPILVGTCARDNMEAKAFS